MLYYRCIPLSSRRRQRIVEYDVKIERHIRDMRQRKRPVFLAAGFFDGVHLGHQEVLRKAVAAARAEGGEAWAMTFDPHPMKVLTPDTAPLMLTDTAHKLQLLRRCGIDGCLLIPFTRRFAATTAAGFLNEIQHGIPALSAIFMGHDWRFGHRGEGNFVMLKTWGKSNGVDVHQVPSVRHAGHAVSSTRIRNAISLGNLNEAAALLGRPFSVLGTVVAGMRIGRKLGFPTANLEAHNEAFPPIGIYAAQAIVGRRAYSGVISYGYHPSVKRLRHPLLELHLLDTRINLYRRVIEVYFLRRLRAERTFPRLPDLIRQIGKDVQTARKVLAHPSLKKMWIKTLQTWHPDIIVTQTNKQKRKR